jgi:hypothetical protein
MITSRQAPLKSPEPHHKARPERAFFRPRKSLSCLTTRITTVIIHPSPLAEAAQITGPSLESRYSGSGMAIGGRTDPTRRDAGEQEDSALPAR